MSAQKETKAPNPKGEKSGNITAYSKSKLSGKPMPVWKEMTEEQKAEMDIALERLNEVSLVGDEVQPEHMLNLDYLNKELEKWLKAQQIEAVNQDDLRELGRWIFLVYR